jgi:cell fate regulator YaaT (PSP1 superfamily)
MENSPQETSYVVRYGNLRALGEFTARQLPPLARQSSVLIRSERGTEWGTVLREATGETRNYLGLKQPTGRILRMTTPDDDDERDRQLRREEEDFVIGRQVIADMRMQMDLVDVERLFGNDRVVFYYVSEQRVDFRELVKTLAKRLQVRIEMRQIGIRDEAKLLADYGDCGKPVCCNTHLREMPPVSMKMAKMQKATLDPNKISGRCGRLKCCLRYEYDTYEEYRKELPAVGSTVVTRQGTGRVVAQEILAKKVLVAYEGQRVLVTSLSDVITVAAGGKKPQVEKPSPDGASQA